MHGERHMWGKVLPHTGVTPGGDDGRRYCYQGTVLPAELPLSLQRPPWPRWARTPR